MEPAGKGSRHWLRRALAFGLFLGVFLMPVKFKWDSVFWERLLDCAHLPAFAAATLFLSSEFPAAWARGPRLALAFFIATAFGVGIEFLQHLTGREASFNDALNSTAGAFLGAMGLVFWPPGGLRRLVFVLYAAGICAAVGLPAWRLWSSIAWRDRSFPVIADFESAAEFRLWHEVIAADNPSGASIRPSPIGVSHGRFSACISTFPREPVPGVRLFLANKDWSRYRTFACDVFNPGPPFTLSLRLDDNLPIRSSYDRFYRALPIATGWNHIRFPMSEIQFGEKNRPLQLTAMRRLLFFLDHPKDLHVFYLDWIRLE